MPDPGGRPQDRPHDPGRTDRRQARREDLRFRLLHRIGGDTPPSQRDLAAAGGVSLGTANTALTGLIADGLVQVGEGITAANGYRLAYVLTAAGKAEVVRLAPRYLARRQAEQAALEAEIAALEAQAGGQ